MGFSTHPHIPTQPPLYSLEGWRLEAAVSGLLYLQWKVTQRFLKTDVLTLWLPWKRRSNSWNIVLCIEYIWVIDVNRIFQVPACVYCRKSSFWQGIFWSFKCEIWKEVCLIVDSYQIIMWYLFFSGYVVPLALQRVKRMFQMWDFPCTPAHCCAVVPKKKTCPHFRGLLVLIAGRLQCQPEMALELGQCQV